MESVSGDEECRNSCFLMHVLRGRWFSVFMAFMMMSVAGSTYLFGTYANEIKDLGYTMDEMEKMNFYKDTGANIGILSGLLLEVTPTWVSFLMCAAFTFGGYFTLYLAVIGAIAKPTVWQMCIYLAIAGNSGNFSNTAAIVTCVKNFPESRGVVVGLLKAMVGLSGAIIKELHYSFYGNDERTLLLFISLLPTTVALVCMFFVRKIRFVRQPHEIRNFYHYLYVSLALAVVLMAMNLSERSYNPFFKQAGMGAFVVGFFFCLILFITIREELFLWRFGRAQETLPPCSVAVSIQNESHCSSEKDSYDDENAVQGKGPRRGDDHTFFQAVFTLDMLLMFVVSLLGLGTGLAAINNVEKIGIALRCTPEMIKSFQSLVSIWNFFGRVFSGYVSESLLQNFRVPRPAVLTVTLALSSIGYLLVVFPFNGSVRIASVIFGFTFGCQTTMFYVLMSELFGLKYYASLFNMSQISMPLGALLLEVWMVNKFYEDAAAMNSIPSLRDTSQMLCEGVECFRVSFSILALVSVLASLISYILWARTRNFYNGDVYEKFRNEQEHCHHISK